MVGNQDGYLNSRWEETEDQIDSRHRTDIDSRHHRRNDRDRNSTRNDKKRSWHTLEHSEYEDQYNSSDMEEVDGMKVARRVYVGNLAWKTSWQELKDFFSQVGTVKYADILREGGPGSRSKGCGIVEFDTPEQAVLAIQQLNHTELDGRSIFIREDREDFELRNLDGTTSPTNNPRHHNAFKRPKSGGPPGPVSIGRRVYVGNLAPNTTWKELKDHFKTAGHVLHADVLSDNDGKSKGCGIVEFSTAAEALRAISHLSNSTLDGRQIMVREDREDPSVAARGGGLGGPSRVNRLGGGPGMQLGGDGTQIVVHGIPYRMAWQDLKDLCRQAGHVVRADIASNPDGSSKGYGIVQFLSVDDAARAIQLLNGQVIDGRVVTVKYDKFAGF